MKLTHLNERPSAFTAACAHAHVSSVGRSVVLGVPTYRWPLAGQPVAFTNQFKQEKSVQLQEPKTRIQGINGLTAKATGMVEAPFAGVDTSGVPPRGRPV